MDFAIQSWLCFVIHIKLISKYCQNLKNSLQFKIKLIILTWYQSLGCDKLVEAQQQGTHRFKWAW